MDNFNNKIQYRGTEYFPHACRTVFHPSLILIRDGSVGTVTRLRSGRPEFDSRQGQGFLFSSPPRPTRLWVPSRILSSGYPGFSLGVERPGRDADNSPSSNAEARNAWSYISTPPYGCMAWCLIKHRVYFTILLLFVLYVVLTSTFHV
jgi:hypothetical protein